MTPSIGQIVLYVHARYPAPLPAIVVAIKVDGRINLSVLNDEAGQSVGPVHFVRDVRALQDVFDSELAGDEVIAGWAWLEEYDELAASKAAFDRQTPGEALDGDEVSDTGAQLDADEDDDLDLDGAEEDKEEAAL